MMRQFTQPVPLAFIFFYPALAQAADSSDSRSGISSLHLIAAAFVGLCFAMPVLWETAKTFLKSRSQKAKSCKKDDTLA
jgi:hypothetical protein